MAGFTTAFSRTTLDSAIADGDKVHWSANGSSETPNLAPTTIAGWDASTDADPTVRQNTSATESAACANSQTAISHYAVFNSGGTTQKTDWTALSSPRTLEVGDKLSIAAGAIKVTLT